MRHDTRLNSILIGLSELLFSVHNNTHLLPSVCHTVFRIIINLVVGNNVQLIEGPQSENKTAFAWSTDLNKFQKENFSIGSEPAAS